MLISQTHHLLHRHLHHRLDDDYPGEEHGGSMTSGWPYPCTMPRWFQAIWEIYSRQHVLGLPQGSCPGGIRTIRLLPIWSSSRSILRSLRISKFPLVVQDLRFPWEADIFWRRGLLLSGEASGRGLLPWIRHGPLSLTTPFTRHAHHVPGRNAHMDMGR